MVENIKREGGKGLLTCIIRISLQIKMNLKNKIKRGAQHTRLPGSMAQTANKTRSDATDATSSSFSLLSYIFLLFFILGVHFLFT